MDLFYLYGAYVKMYFKSRREYRGSFWTGFIANFYTYFFVYATFWVLTQKFNVLGGWDFHEISVLYSLNLLTYAISGTLFWYSIYHLENLVISGEFDRYLLRPLGIIPQLMCHMFGYTFLGQIVVSSCFLLSSLNRVTTPMSLAKYVYLITALIGGVLIQAGGIIFIGALSFWIIRSKEVGNIFYYHFREFINYPLNIFPQTVKSTLTFIFPWAFINYYPATILLNKAESQFDTILGVLSPFVGALFFLSALCTFQISMKRYTSTGS